jgi:enterochelin esterase family protein
MLPAARHNEERRTGMVRRATGTVVHERVASEALRGNPLGDPHERDAFVYLPPGYARGGERRHPTVVVLTGFTGKGAMPFHVQAFGEALHERLDRLLGEGRIPPLVVAVPDCFTALGGSQYVDSPAVGRYETFVVKEFVPWLDATFRTAPAARRRAVCGKSSGGYGALMLAMRHPDVFGALASHSGDAYFDYCYRFDFVKCWNALRAAGGVEKWLRAFRAKPRATSDDVGVLNIVAMAACYSPNADAPGGFDLPFDAETGEEDAAVMARWRRHDPVVACRRHAAALRRLRGIYLDCGLRDEFQLQVGTRILAKRLRELGLDPVHEEFDDGHMSISYRYDRSFPFLGKWIGG